MVGVTISSCDYDNDAESFFGYGVNKDTYDTIKTCNKDFVEDMIKDKKEELDNSDTAEILKQLNYKIYINTCQVLAAIAGHIDMIEYFMTVGADNIATALTWTKHQHVKDYFSQN